MLSIPLWCDWDGPRRALQLAAHGTFNPTVVRLGRRGSRQSPSPASLFQSHCGAIGTGWPPVNAPQEARKLSIPLWCDWDRRGAPLPSYLYRLSIPLWCDWDILSTMEDWCGNCLSIPLWCDWDFPCRCSSSPLLPYFQSHCGAIGTRPRPPLRPRPRPRPLSFQSHCGAIGTHRNGHDRPGALTFQSHCGAIGTSI